MLQVIKLVGGALLARSVVKEGIGIYQDYQMHRAKLETERQRAEMLKEMAQSERTRATTEAPRSTSQGFNEESLTEVVASRISSKAKDAQGFFDKYATRFKGREEDMFEDIPEENIKLI